MPDILLILFILSAGCSFILFIKKDRLVFLIISSFLFAMSTLTKEITLFATPILAAFIFMKYKKNWLKSIRLSIVLFSVYSLILLPRMIYMHDLTGEWCISTNQLWVAGEIREYIKSIAMDKRVKDGDYRATTSIKKTHGTPPRTNSSNRATRGFFMADRNSGCSSG